MRKVLNIGSKTQQCSANVANMKFLQEGGLLEPESFIVIIGPGERKALDKTNAINGFLNMMEP